MQLKVKSRKGSSKVSNTTKKGMLKLLGVNRKFVKKEKLEVHFVMRKISNAIASNISTDIDEQKVVDEQFDNFLIESFNSFQREEYRRKLLELMRSGR